MRLRNVTGSRDVIAADEYAIHDPYEQKALKGHWNGLFGRKAPLKLELGSGKGRFITTLAQRDTDIDFIACEGAFNVYPRILQKAAALELPNLRVLSEYVADPTEFFADGEISGIYLNFSDPWKKRTANRRLTYREKLEGYRRICKSGATLEFKTDNSELFEYSLGELSACGLVPDIIETDLHASPLEIFNIHTEYEDKFTERGEKIKYFRISFT